jgi:hypothetical protein
MFLGWGEASASRFSQHHVLFRRKATPRNCRRRKPFANSATRRRSSGVTALWLQLDVSCHGWQWAWEANKRGYIKSTATGFHTACAIQWTLMHFSGWGFGFTIVNHTLKGIATTNNLHRGNIVNLCKPWFNWGLFTTCFLAGIGSLQGSEHADKYRCDTKHLGSMITVAGKTGMLRCFSQW